MTALIALAAVLAYRIQRGYTNTAATIHTAMTWYRDLIIHVALAAKQCVRRRATRRRATAQRPDKRPQQDDSLFTTDQLFELAWLDDQMRHFNGRVPKGSR